MHGNRYLAGLGFGLLAYLMWGFFPLYFRQLSHVALMDVLSHRAAWARLFDGLLLTLRGQWGKVRAVFGTPRRLAMLALAALLIASNWLAFLWAVAESAGGRVEPRVLPHPAGQRAARPRRPRRTPESAGMGVGRVRLGRHWQRGRCPRRPPLGLAFARRHLRLLRTGAQAGAGAKFQFNTVVSAGMKILNALEKAPADEPSVQAQLTAEGLSILLRLLSPVTPHICHALWRERGYGEDILAAPWPEPLEAALAQEEIELVLQVNGRLRGQLRVPAAAPKDEIERLALSSEVAQ